MHIQGSMKYKGVLNTRVLYLTKMSNALEACVYFLIVPPRLLYLRTDNGLKNVPNNDVQC